MPKKIEKCSFCDKKETEVYRLISGGPDICICDECILACFHMLDFDNEEKQESEYKLSDEIMLIKPAEIKGKLDDYVVGQEHAKKVLSVAVYNHYKRILHKEVEEEQDIELQKSNVLLIGSTGSGKTLLAETLAKILNVPFAIADATTLTEAGYVGEDVENVLVRLFQAADCDINAVSKGIIYIDEVDKIGRKSENMSITRDVSGEGVQQALLKIIEGTKSNIPPSGGRKHPHQEFIEIDTKNILFILGGAFESLEKIIKARTNKSSLGFGAEIKTSEEDKKDNILKDIHPEDLVKYGLIPELVGRLPVITVLEELDENALIKILNEPKNALSKQYKKFFELEGVELEFEPDALKEVAKIALTRKTGARGLRSVMESIMLDLMYEIPSMSNKIEKIVITKDAILDNKKVVLVNKKELTA